MAGEGRLTGKGTVAKGASAQCDGEHRIRKQMSLPKHGLVPCIFICKKIRNVIHEEGV